MKAILCFVAALFLTANAYADEQIPLFKDYHYGMSKGQIAATGAVSCAEVLGESDDDLKDALCAREEVQFLKQDWLEMFVFDDDKLLRVALIKEFEPASYMAAIGGMINNKFMPILMMQGNNSLDVVSTIKEQGQQRASELISDFEQKALTGPSEYTAIFLPVDFVKNNKSKSGLQMLRSAQANVRCVTISKKDEALVLTFESLGQTIKSMMNIMKNSKESF